MPLRDISPLSRGALCKPKKDHKTDTLCGVSVFLLQPMLAADSEPFSRRPVYLHGRRVERFPLRLCSWGTLRPDVLHISGCTRGPAVSRSRSAPYRSLKCRFALVLCRGGCGRRRPFAEGRSSTVRGFGGNTVSPNHRATRAELPALFPQAIQKYPHKRGSISTLRFNNLRGRAALGSGDKSPAGVQGAEPPAGGYGGRAPVTGEEAPGQRSP